MYYSISYIYTIYTYATAVAQNANEIVIIFYVFVITEHMSHCVCMRICQTFFYEPQQQYNNIFIYTVVSHAYIYCMNIQYYLFDSRTLYIKIHTYSIQHPYCLSYEQFVR